MSFPCRSVTPAVCSLSKTQSLLPSTGRAPLSALASATERLTRGNALIGREASHRRPSYAGPSPSEPALAQAKPEQAYQFERQGYFCLDSKDASEDNLVFNRTVGLRDTWAKIGD